jgi:hypothetical protein
LDIAAQGQGYQAHHLGGEGCQKEAGCGVRVGISTTSFSFVYAYLVNAQFHSCHAKIHGSVELSSLTAEINLLISIAIYQ